MLYGRFGMMTKLTIQHKTKFDSTLFKCLRGAHFRMNLPRLVILCLSLVVVMRTIVENIIHDNAIKHQGYQYRPFECQGCFPKSFKLLMNNKDICKRVKKSQNISTLFLITTTHEHVLERKVLRETWLRDSLGNTGDVRYVFLLGTVESAALQQQVQDENNIYQDILQFQFVDSYRNLTYKSMMGFHWSLKFCNNVKFVFKTDDDVYINIPNGLRLFSENENLLHSSVGGECLNNSKRDNNPSSKWYVQPHEYPLNNYPGHCSGYGYVTSMAVINLKQVVKISINIPFFHLEDVYFGFCIDKLNFTFQNLKGFFKDTDIRHKSCNFKSPNFVITYHVSKSVMKQIWESPCLMNKHSALWNLLFYAIGMFS